MCTAASDSQGWVTFLREVVEEWYGARIYDHVIAQETIDAWHAWCGTRHDCPKSGSRIKDMDMVRMVVAGADLRAGADACVDARERGHGMVAVTTHVHRGMVGDEEKSEDFMCSFTVMVDMTTPVLAVDDRAEHIHNHHGDAKRVSQYIVALNLVQLCTRDLALYQGLWSPYYSSLQNGWMRYVDAVEKGNAAKYHAAPSDCALLEIAMQMRARRLE